MEPTGQLNFSQSPASLLVDLAEHAEAGAGALNLGVAAVGTLMAHAAVAVEDSSISADVIEALGWMMSELGVVSAYCLALSAKCRQARNSRNDPRIDEG